MLIEDEQTKCHEYCGKTKFEKCKCRIVQFCVHKHRRINGITTMNSKSREQSKLKKKKLVNLQFTNESFRLRWTMALHFFGHKGHVKHSENRSQPLIIISLSCENLIVIHRNSTSSPSPSLLLSPSSSSSEFSTSFSLS